MVLYSHLLKNFPQFVVVHTVKGFGVVNKAEADIFWNSLAFSVIQWMLAIWSLVPLLFLNPAWISGSSSFMYCWSLAWRILSITLLACEMSAIVWQFEHSLALPFFGIGMKTDIFQFLDTYSSNVRAYYIAPEVSEVVLISFNYCFLFSFLLHLFWPLYLPPHLSSLLPQLFYYCFSPEYFWSQLFHYSYWLILI